MRAVPGKEINDTFEWIYSGIFFAGMIAVVVLSLFVSN